MRGVGKSVFAGERIEEFQVEILGTLDNIGPRQSLILARLSGGPLDRTGVMQGMSGSPVYIGGKLLGAVAMAFPFSKEPIAGIRPFEEMIPVGSAGPLPVLRSGISLRETDLTRVLPRPQEALAGESRMVEIATPVSFGGFTSAAVERFAPQLRALGLEPRQGITAGGRGDTRMGDPSQLKPGSMIAVQLMTGDMSVGADGTLTAIDGNKVYAFGHRFLSVGATELPFARAEVLALLPAITTSFKISTARELMGCISQDRNTAIFGELGRRARTAPVTVDVTRGGRKLDGYRMNMVDDRLLSPLLVQMAVFSAIDATERTVGAASFRVSGQIEFDGASPVKLDNMYSADNGSPMLVSLGASIPLAYVLQSGFPGLRVKSVDLHIDSSDQKKQFQIDDVSVAHRTVRPGEKVELTAVLAGDNGVEVERKVEYRVPESFTPGPLYFTVADGTTTNLTEFRQYLTIQPKSTAQLIALVNALRPNTRAYVRVWRPEAAFQLAGEELADPPPSVAMLLTNAQRSSGGITQVLNSKIAEMEIGAGEVVISGAKTILVDVKE